MAGFDPNPAPEILGGDRRLAAALDLEKAQRALAAGNRPRPVEQAPRGASAFGPPRAQHLYALASTAEIGLEEGARKGGKAASLVVDNAGRPAPVDPGLLVRDLPGVGGPPGRLRLEGQLARFKRGKGPHHQ